MRSIETHLGYVETPANLQAVALALVLVGSFADVSSALAQTAESDAFTSACDAALSAIQEDRRVCVVGVVESDTEVRVLLSNRSDLIFKRVSIFQSPIMQGQQIPLDGLGKLKGQTVAIGGFDNGPTLYSAKLLSP